MLVVESQTALVSGQNFLSRLGLAASNGQTNRPRDCPGEPWGQTAFRSAPDATPTAQAVRRQELRAGASFATNGRCRRQATFVWLRGPVFGVLQTWNCGLRPGRPLGTWHFGKQCAGCSGGTGSPINRPSADAVVSAQSASRRLRADRSNERTAEVRMLQPATTSVL